MGGVNDGAFRPNESGVEGPQKGQQGKSARMVKKLI